MNISFTKIGRFFFYIFIFLLPLFYVPNSIVSIELNKSLFLLSILTIVLAFFTAGAIKQGKIRIEKGVISLGVLAFLIFVSISTVFFSLNPLNSFFGENGSADSLIAFLMYGLVFFLVLGLFEKKEQLKYIATALILSISVLNIGFLGKVFLTGSFFPPLSSLNVLAILNVLAMISVFFFFKEEKNPSIKGIAGVSFFLFLTGLVVINFNIAWFLLAIASFLIFWTTLFKKEKKYNGIALTITVISVFLFFLAPHFPFEKTTLVQTLSFYESTQVIKGEGPSVLGFGPASFDDQFLKYNPLKAQDVIYGEASSVILTILNDFGILGTILFLAPFSLAIFIGFRGFFFKKQNIYEEMSFISFFSLFVLLFFFGLDLVLMVLLFLFLGLFVVSYRKEKTFVFKKSDSNVIFLSIAGLSLVLVGMIVLIYFYFLNYSAENYYNLAIQDYEQSRDKAISNLEKSSSILEKEKTAIGLSQLYLLKASNFYTESRLLETKEADREVKKQECEKFMHLSEKRALRATEISPFDYYAWLNLGNIYNNRRYLRDEDLTEKAINAYVRASKLAPYSKVAYIALIEIYSELGNLEKREEYLEKIQVIDPAYL